MIRRWRFYGYHRAIAGTGNDTDSLQTDVMRFMSILGLCLMAVFALVQSLPMQQPEQPYLQDDIISQQQRAKNLKEELQNLLSLIEQAYLEKTQTEQVLTTAKQQLAETLKKNRQAQNIWDRLNHAVNMLQKDLQQTRQQLDSLEKAASKKTRTISFLQKSLQQETSKLDDLRKKTQQLKTQQAEEQRQHALQVKQQQRELEKHRRLALPQQAEPKTKSVNKQKTIKATKKGFTLRFSSDEALEQQLSNGTVKLYAMSDKTAWRLSLSNGRPAFHPASTPNWFHEMAASTVPVEYVRHLTIAVAPKSRESITWGVQLPPTTKKDINSLTRTRLGGELVIASNGRVNLAEE